MIGFLVLFATFKPMHNKPFISTEVEKTKISSDVNYISSVSIRGDKTSIAPGCILGEEGPVILENCQLGRNVRLKGGYFKDAVFLDYASMGAGAHVYEKNAARRVCKRGSYRWAKADDFFPICYHG